MVALFGGPVPQAVDLLAQAPHLLSKMLDHGVLLGEQRLPLEEFVSLCQLFSQDLLLFSHSEQFFFERHARTLLALLPFGKSPADLGCYGFSLISCSIFSHQPPMSEYSLKPRRSGKAHACRRSILCSSSRRGNS